MKKILICLLTLLLLLTGCTNKKEEVVDEIKPSEVIYWGIDDNGILYLSPTKQGYAIYENSSLFYVKNWDDRYDIPWWECDDKPYYDGGHGIRGIEILSDKDEKIKPFSTAYWFCGCNKCEYIYGLENIDTSLVTNMESMFRGMFRIMELDVSSLNTSNVSNMQGMFCGLSLSSLDLSSFDTSNVTNMSYMFSGCGNIVSINLSSFDTSNVTDMSYMFDECWSLEHIDVSNFDTTKVKTFESMFGNLDENKFDISNFDFSSSNVTNPSDLFWVHI